MHRFIKNTFCPGMVLWLGMGALAIWAALNTPQLLRATEGGAKSASTTPLRSEKDLSPDELAKLHYLASTNTDKTMSDSFPVPSKDALKGKLSPLQYDVCLNKGTERAFTGEYWDNHAEGTYLCRVCGLPLFKSSTKFESGTGWPSFFQPVDAKHIKVQQDTSHGMIRGETVCANCGSHLGHVFDDGPRPTGLRYCMNSASLLFVSADAAAPAAEKKE